MEWFRKNKRSIFPEIKDWTDPQNKKRFDDRIKQMSYKDWFWFHPSAFNLIYWGINIIALVFMIPVAVYLLNKFIIGSLILGVIAFYNAKALRDKWRSRHVIKKMNFYDLYMREYGVKKNE